FGLDAALRDLCDSLQSGRTSIHFYSSNIDKSLSQNEQLIIYRIIQELLNNALKYADSSEIIVDCMQEADTILVTVEDNGVGFKDRAEPAEGVGLLNVRNRVSYLNGQMVIESEPGQGATVRITVKVNNRSKDFFINEEGVLGTSKK
ncbi:MAG TPA: ATP-binding protein, partial [Niabella sp.]